MHLLFLHFTTLHFIPTHSECTLHLWGGGVGRVGLTTQLPSPAQPSAAQPSPVQCSLPLGGGVPFSLWGGRGLHAGGYPSCTQVGAHLDEHQFVRGARSNPTFAQPGFEPTTLDLPGEFPMC